MKVPITVPTFGINEYKLVKQTLDSGWVAQGPKVAEFEQIVANFAEMKYAVATTSATTALFLSLHLLGVGPGDEVIVPSFTFIATANVVVHCGAKPVFVDIDPESYNIDPKLIEDKITSHTKAIIPVDQVGMPAQMAEIRKIAKKHNLWLIQDSACSLGSKINGRSIFKDADLACLSFHPRKVITTGEGGMILTNNRKWAAILRQLRHHGMSISDTARHAATKVVHENYNQIGYNFRMSDLQAAVGIGQMKLIDRLISKRRKLAQRYNKAFKNFQYLSAPIVEDGVYFNYQSYIVRLSPKAPVSRDKLMQILLDAGVSTRRGVMAIHRELAYLEILGKVSLPMTEEATDQTICLPLYPNLTFAQQDYVIAKLQQILED